MRDRLRALLPRLAALLLGLGLALALGELGTRLLFTDDRPPSPTSFSHVPGLYSDDPGYGVIFTPGFEGELAHPAGGIALRINRLGLRGPEPTALVVGPRWLLLGDSYVMGLQVPEERTVAARLQERLGVPVINGGVSGMDTWDEIALHGLVRSELSISGTILVIYTGNDLVDNTLRRRVPPPTPPPLQPRSSSAPAGSTVFNWLSHRSMLALTAYTFLHRFASTWAPGHQDHHQKPTVMFYSAQPEPELHQALSPTVDAVRALRDRGQAHGEELVVALVPPAWVVDPRRRDSILRASNLGDVALDLEAPHRALLSRFEQEGLHACDLTGALVDAQRAGGEPYLRLDGHWSAEGHEVAARALASCLDER
jgi:lysophospholipase L1-like esterase